MYFPIPTVRTSLFQILGVFGGIFHLYSIFDRYEPRSDKRDLLTIKVKSEISTEKERPSCCEQLQKI